MRMTTGHLVSFAEQSLYSALLCGLTGHDNAMILSFSVAGCFMALHRFLFGQRNEGDNKHE